LGDRKDVVFSTHYYLFYVPVDEYDINKTGTIKSGKYIIRYYDEMSKDEARYRKTYSFPILSVTDSKLILEFANKSVCSFHKK